MLLILRGTEGNDVLRAEPGNVLLRGVEEPFVLRAIGFGEVTAHGNGGNDIAFTVGSEGDDTFYANETNTLMTANSIRNRTVNFSEVNADGLSGNDEATLRDALGDDSFSSAGASASLSANDESFSNQVTGFGLVRAVGNQGGIDTLDVGVDTAFEVEVFGQWES